MVKLASVSSGVSQEVSGLLCWSISGSRAEGIPPAEQAMGLSVALGDTDHSLIWKNFEPNGGETLCELIGSNAPSRDAEGVGLHASPDIFSDAHTGKTIGDIFGNGSEGDVRFTESMINTRDGLNELGRLIALQSSKLKGIYLRL